MEKKNDKEMITLYKHQNDMVKASAEHAKGVFVAPTGSGKTLAQADIVAHEILTNGFKVIVVKTPRISLSNQICQEYTSYLYKNYGMCKGRNYDSIILHSGKADEAPDDYRTDNNLDLARYFKQFPEAESDALAVANLMEAARDKKIPFVIFTTYHSTEKAWNIINDLGESVTLDINDEGHFLTQRCFNNIFDLYEPKRQYSFTATLRETDSDEGRGMNNVDKFGQEIYKLPIAEAIQKDLILPILPHFIECDEDVDSFSELKAIGQMVQKSFKHLEENTMLPPKMLVATQGADQIEEFIKSPECQELLDQGVNVLTVHSNKTCNTINGEVVKEAECHKKRNELGEDVDAKMLLLHYDKLSEGIDIPGLTGVVILRSMKTAKFLQTIGRVIRVYRKNPSLKKAGMLYFPDLSDKDLFVKFNELLKTAWQEGAIPREHMDELLAIGTEDDEEGEEPWNEAAASRRSKRYDFLIKNGYKKVEDNFGSFFKIKK
jgi:superfamily II DNA or RNA helicase